MSGRTECEPRNKPKHMLSINLQQETKNAQQRNESLFSPCTETATHTAVKLAPHCTWYANLISKQIRFSYVYACVSVWGFMHVCLCGGLCMGVWGPTGARQLSDIVSGTELKTLSPSFKPWKQITDWNIRPDKGTLGERGKTLDIGLGFVWYRVSLCSLGWSRVRPGSELDQAGLTFRDFFACLQFLS